MNVPDYLFPIVAAIIAGISSATNFWMQHNASPTPHKGLYLILWGSLLSTAFALGSWVKSESDRERRETAEHQWQETQGELQQKIAEQAEELYHLSKTQLDYFTGGDSYLYFRFANHADGYPVATLVVEGENPVWHPDVEVWNLHTYATARESSDDPLTMRKQSVHSKSYTIVRTNAAKALNSFPIPESGRAFYMLVSSQATGFYYQLVSIYQLKTGHCAFATSVYKKVGARGDLDLLQPVEGRRVVDPDFPVAARETVDHPEMWSPNLELVNNERSP